MNPSFCCKNNQRRQQKRQREELAQHTIERANRQIADVPCMWQMVHTLLTILTIPMHLRMHVKRRQQKHWQEYCQQHHRRNMSPCRHFHAAKVQLLSVKCQMSNVKCQMLNDK